MPYHGKNLNYHLEFTLIGELGVLRMTRGVSEVKIPISTLAQAQENPKNTEGKIQFGRFSSIRVRIDKNSRNAAYIQHSLNFEFN